MLVVEEPVKGGAGREMRLGSTLENTETPKHCATAGLNHVTGWTLSRRLGSAAGGNLRSISMQMGSIPPSDGHVGSHSREFTGFVASHEREEQEEKVSREWRPGHIAAWQLVHLTNR